jgi:hypothetical protein
MQSYLFLFQRRIRIMSAEQDPNRVSTSKMLQIDTCMLMRLQTPRHIFAIPFYLVEETDDLSCNVLATGLLVVHDTGGGGEDHVSELTGGKELDNPLLEIGETDVVAGRDDSGLVKAAVELDDDLAGSVVVDFFKFTDVA